LASATIRVPHPDPRSTIGPVPEFSTAVIIAREVALELGEGEMPVFIDANTIEIPANTIHAIRMTSIINIRSKIVYYFHGLASTPAVAQSH
jgi:hypothetical protein